MRAFPAYHGRGRASSCGNFSVSKPGRRETQMTAKSSGRRDVPGARWHGVWLGSGQHRGGHAAADELFVVIGIGAAGTGPGIARGLAVGAAEAACVVVAGIGIALVSGIIGIIG